MHRQLCNACTVMLGLIWIIGQGMMTVTLTIFVVLMLLPGSRFVQQFIIHTKLCFVVWIYVQAQLLLGSWQLAKGKWPIRTVVWLFDDYFTALLLPCYGCIINYLSILQFYNAYAFMQSWVDVMLGFLLTSSQGKWPIYMVGITIYRLFCDIYHCPVGSI